MLNIINKAIITMLVSGRSLVAYIAALIAAKKYTFAREKLEVLTHFIKILRTDNQKFGFNEWIKVQDGKPMGQDWQSWSSAFYLYAAKCVEDKNIPFLTDTRL